MKHPMVCLSLVFPPGLEDDVTDFLLSRPAEEFDGMTVSKAEGIGEGFALQDAREKVRGRAARTCVQVVLSQDHAATLIAALKTEFHHGEMVYWLIPVLDFGRLA